MNIKKLREVFVWCVVKLLDFVVCQSRIRTKNRAMTSFLSFFLFVIIIIIIIASL